MAEKKDGLPAKVGIIFIPGLGREIVDQRLESIARKMAGALDRQAPRAEPMFKVIGMPEEEYGNSYRAQVRAIGVHEPGKEEVKAMVDLYELDYRDNLTRRFEGRSPLSKVLVMVSALIPVAWRSVWKIRKRSTDLRDQLQVLTMALIMLAVAAFIGIVLWAGFQTIADAVEYGPGVFLKALTGKVQESETNSARKKPVRREGSTIIPSDQQLGRADLVQPGDKEEGENPNTEAVAQTHDKAVPRLSLWQALVVLLAALGLFKRDSLKETVSLVATEYVCASNYLRLANQKQVILGQATALLEHIAEKGEKYRGVYIVSYSFGTLLAIDLLFPHIRPGPRLAMVERLVTIGCPFDLVRTYWPNYFMQRLRLEGVPRRWINLYAPLDVFASNFRNDRQRMEADQGLRLQDNESEVVSPDTNIAYDAGLQTEQLTCFDVLTVKGVKLHSMYWIDEDVPELSCFDSVVAELFEGDAVLSDKDGGE